MIEFVLGLLTGLLAGSLGLVTVLYIYRARIASWVLSRSMQSLTPDESLDPFEVTDE